MKNYIYKLILFVCISIPYGLAAQTGGGASYLFLDLANDARLSSFGMPATSIYDDDINMAITNPSLINANMNNALSLSYNNYFGTHLGFIFKRFQQNRHLCRNHAVHQLRQIQICR